MSHENVEIVRRVYADWAKGNFRDAKAFDPDVECHWVSPDAIITHGIGELGGAWREWLSPWEHLTIEAEELVDAGDRVVALHVVRGRGRASGAATEWHSAFVFELRDGRVVRLDAYDDQRAALEAAGVAT